MLQKNHIRFGALLLANAAVWCVLGLHQATVAAPQGGQPPFANSVEQRAETNRQLAEIAGLLKEQNALLRSGKLTVIVQETP
jgi:hypothetical protein